jgi:hypothetical protein
MAVSQSAKLFSSRRNWDSPNPSPAGDCAPPPGSGGRGTLAGEREGLGESQFRRGNIHLVLFIYMYFVGSILYSSFPGIENAVILTTKQLKLLVCELSGFLMTIYLTKTCTLWKLAHCLGLEQYIFEN